MHSWGDGFPYFEEVNQAAYEIGEFCKRWGRIQVTQTKEKFGTARVYCHFGVYGLHDLTHPGYAYSRYPKWLWNLDCRILSKLLSPLNRILIPYQEWIYRLAYRRALKKYPFIQEEILGGASYGKLLTNGYLR